MDKDTPTSAPTETWFNSTMPSRSSAQQQPLFGSFWSRSTCCSKPRTPSAHPPSRDTPDNPLPHRYKPSTSTSTSKSSKRPPTQTTHRHHHTFHSNHNLTSFGNSYSRPQSKQSSTTSPPPTRYPSTHGSLRIHEPSYNNAPQPAPHRGRTKKQRLHKAIRQQARKDKTQWLNDLL